MQVRNVISAALVSFLTMTTTAALAMGKCPTGYVLDDDGSCVKVGGHGGGGGPQCPTPASDGTCLSVTRNSANQITFVQGKGKDGVTRTLTYDFQSTAMSVNGPMPGCNPPDATHDGPWNCVGIVHVDSSWNGLTYSDSSGKYLRIAMSISPQIAGARFVIENRTNRVATTVLGNVDRGGWAKGAMNVEYSGVHYTWPFEYNIETRDTTLSNDWRFAFPELDELKFFDGALPPPPTSGWGVRAFGDGVIGLAVGTAADVLGFLEVSAFWPVGLGMVAATAYDYWQNTPAARDKTGEVFVNPVCAGARTMDELDALFEPNVPEEQTFFHAMGCD